MLRELYFSLEEKYYKFLDWLDSKGIPVYNAVDKIDKVMPSFILVLILGFILLLLVVYAIAASFGVFLDTNSIYLTLKDRNGSIIPNQAIEVLTDDKTFKIMTDQFGTATFSSKPNSLVTVKGTVGSESFTRPLQIISGQQNYTLSLTFAVGTQRINFSLNAPTPITSPLNISFACSNPLATPPQGIIGTTLISHSVDVDPTCGTLSASINSDAYTRISSVALFDGSSITLSSTSSQGGNSLVVNVIRADSTPIPSVSVTLATMNGMPFQSESSETGSVRFNNLGILEYQIVASADGFVPSTPQTVRFTSDLEQKTLNVTLNSSTQSQGFIVLRFIDELNNRPITSGSACFYHYDQNQRGALIGCPSVDQEGYVKMQGLDSSKKYFIVSKRDGYREKILRNVSASLTAPALQVLLKRKGTNDRDVVKVKVVDSQDIPVSNATVYMYNESGFANSNEYGITDANGLARVFSDEGTFKAYAFKASFSGLSDVFDFSLSSDTDYDVLVKLDIPYSSLRISIKDGFSNPVPNALVSLYDIYGQKVFEGSNHSDALGEYVKTSLRSDKKYYYVIQKEGFENYISVAQFLVPNTEKLESVQLTPLSLDRRLRMTVQGIFNSRGEAVQRVAPGSLYRMNYKVILPQDNDLDYDEVFAVFVAGDNDIIEKENFYLEKIEASGMHTITKGQRYVSNNEEETRTPNRTSASQLGESDVFQDQTKWMQLSWDMDDMEVNSGILNVDVYFRVKNKAFENSQLTFMYSLSAQTNDGDVFFPIESRANIDPDYVTTNKSRYLAFSGLGQQVCDEKFCIETSVYDVENEIVSNLVSDSSYIAFALNEYNFRFSLLNNSDVPLTNYRIIVENPEESLFFKDYKIISVSNETTNSDLTSNRDTSNNYEVVYIQTNSISRNNVVRGDILFEPRKIGNSAIRFRVIENNREIYTKEFYINVSADKEMNVEISPSFITSYTNSELLLNITDKSTKEGLQDVKIVFIDKDNIKVAEGTSESNGRALISIPSQKPNLDLRVQVNKKDYKPFEKIMRTSSEFLSLNPEELFVKIDVTQGRGTANLTIKNNSDMSVDLNVIRLVGNFDEYIDLVQVNENLSSAFTNLTINGGQEVVIPINLTLTQTGLLIDRSLQYNASLNLVVFKSYGQGFWNYSVPVKVGLNLGPSLDSLDCISLDSKEGRLVSTDAMQINDAITIVNGCSVNGSAVKLQNIEAKVEWEKNSLGSIVLGKDERETRLEQAYYKTIAMEMNPLYQDTYTMNILPKSGNIQGEGKVSILVRGSYMSNSGLQFVEKKLDLDVSVIRVSDCFSFELPDSESDMIKVYRGQEVDVKVKNLCNNQTDLRFDIYPQDFVVISPSEFTLLPQREQIIKVRSNTSPVGVYQLELRARTLGTTYQGIKTGIRGFRVFVQPLETDCLVMDNYEFNLVDTNEYNRKYGYLINRCYEVPINFNYSLEIKNQSSYSGMWRDYFSTYLTSGFTSSAANMLSGWGIGKTANPGCKVGDIGCSTDAPADTDTASTASTPVSGGSKTPTSGNSSSTGNDGLKTAEGVLKAVETPEVIEAKNKVLNSS